LAGKRHKIIDGDTLTAIANRYLGSEERYLDLFEHNRDVLTHPELLPIGKELRIPPPGFVRAAEPPRPSQSSNLTEVAPVPGPSDFRRLPQPRSTQPALATTDRAAQQTYVVQAHDTLGLIARKVYGDIARQSELLAANRQQLRTPQDLRPGMTLIVPAAKKSQ
jgi:nucleoid-associated protein YgaU